MAGRVLWGLGHARRLQGNLSGAERAYRDALDLHLRTYGERHQDVAWGYYNLAAVQEAMGEDEAAATSFALAAELLASLQEPDYLYTGFAYHGLGRVQERRGRPEEAAEAFQRALRVYGAQRSGDPAGAATRIAAVRLALGRIHLDGGRWDAAETELRAAFLLYRDEARSAEGVERASEALVELFEATARPDSAAHYRASRPRDGDERVEEGAPLS